jgi:ATP-dependent DNA helicase DinG
VPAPQTGTLGPMSASPPVSVDPSPPSTEALTRFAMEAFDAALAVGPGFRQRAGQRRMAEEVARTLASATLGKPANEDPPLQAPRADGSTPASNPGHAADSIARAIAVIQAGTGVGKSLAYCAPAIALALARGTRVMISTATVALQEQLVHKDLPALAAALPELPFRFALAKGRGRYVCRLKLERLGGLVEPGSDTAGEDAEFDDLFADELAADRAVQAARSPHEKEAQLRFYSGMAQALASGAWDGDRDTLQAPPAGEVWGPMAADAASCTGRHCPNFNQCAYYERRKTLVGAQVIVVNHDLLLASLGNRLLPELDNCLLVLDEAHHLPATALAQFACRMDLGSNAWIERLAQRAVRVGVRLEVTEVADIPQHAARLRAALQDVQRLVLDLFGDALVPSEEAVRAPAGAQWGGTRHRLAEGRLPEVLVTPLGQVAHHADGFLTALRAIATALKAELRDRPDAARSLAALYAQIGALAPRLEEVHATAQLLLQDTEPGQAPPAKWFTCTAPIDGAHGGQPLLQAHASPLLPGATLRQRLWSTVRGAVLTSATLTSCARFDFFLRESGLDRLHAAGTATTLEVPSPFDYPAQGRLLLRRSLADPRDAADFTAEMVRTLVNDIAHVRHGALVLFTSREQLRQAVEALPSVLRSCVQIQTAMPRLQLMQTHRERVAAGLPSVIFGMQSFGEGLDLPGALCETVFIAKLPFAPPDDPVGEARAEWLRAIGRDPFTELVLPATAIRLAQWVGRAIRTEEDRATIVSYDPRLGGTAYGARLLQGLPAFVQQRLQPGEALPPQTSTPGSPSANGRVALAKTDSVREPAL